MAPRKKKKQKTRSSPSAAADIVPDITQSASERLPTELLQMIFEYLSLYDLIRCTQVCKTWGRCLPGDHLKLSKALFLRGDQSANAEGSLRLKFNFRIFGNVNRLTDDNLPRLMHYLQEHDIDSTIGGSTCVNPTISCHEQIYHIVHSGHQPDKDKSLFYIRNTGAPAVDYDASWEYHRSRHMDGYASLRSCSDKIGRDIFGHWRWYEGSNPHT